MSRGECPDPVPECQYFNTDAGCFSDTDHLYSPAYRYKTLIEKTFRELPSNKQQICRRLHDLKNATEPHPEKPSREFMCQAIASEVLRQVERNEGEIHG